MHGSRGVRLPGRQRVRRRRLRVPADDGIPASWKSEGVGARLRGRDPVMTRDDTGWPGHGRPAGLEGELSILAGTMSGQSRNCGHLSGMMLRSPRNNQSHSGSSMRARLKYRLLRT